MKSVSKLTASDIFPIDKIKAQLGLNKVNISILKNAELMNHDPSGYGQALHFGSVQLIGAGKIQYIPEEFRTLEGTPEFILKLKGYVLQKTRTRLPTDQILFEINDDDGFTIAELHIGETVLNQWHITDIALQDKSKPLGINDMNAGYAGLGGMIFNEIMMNI